VPRFDYQRQKRRRRRPLAGAARHRPDHSGRLGTLDAEARRARFRIVTSPT
jgi:hypothetical protein